MRIERHDPTDILRPFIKSFTIIESETGMVNKILPDTSVVMAFRYKGTTFAAADGQDLPASAVSGLTRSARSIGYSKETAAILVTFREGGASAFSAAPLHELFGLHVSLDHLFHHRKLANVEEQLAEAKDHAQRFSIFERFMLSELKEARTDPLILHAIQNIRAVNGNLRIKDLAKNLSISQDRFEKLFRQAIGASPKQFAKIVRFRSLIGKYSQTNELTNTALLAGYFDQSHFIKEFKSFTGQTPRDFFSSPSIR